MKVTLEIIPNDLRKCMYCKYISYSEMDDKKLTICDKYNINTFDNATCNDFNIPNCHNIPINQIAEYYQKIERDMTNQKYLKMNNKKFIKTLKDGDKISFRYRQKQHIGFVQKTSQGEMRAVVYGENNFRTRVNIALSSAQQIKLLNNE